MADAPRLSLAALREIVSDPSELSKGTRIHDEGGLAHLARFETKLYADAAGSGAAPYKVQIGFEGPGAIKGRCSCMAARSRPFCKHAAALLVAWARSPESFAVADVAPAPVGGGDAKRKSVKTGKTEAKELMARGVDQTAALVRELGVSGVAAMAADRAEQVRALGENLREARLRRMSARTLELSSHLARAATRSDAFDATEYAELLGDLLLTVRKLEKHLGGEALADEHVEELIGKTWGKKDRRPIEGLELLEYTFAARTTPDEFVIRESRFLDLGSGEHFSEKQILPAFLAKRTDPKKSWAGRVLERPAASIYPSYPPRRLDLDGITARPSVRGDLERLVERALPDVGAALAAMQERRKDVFAPDALPVAMRADAILAEGGRLQIVDAKNAAVFLPDDDGIEEALARVLRSARLHALIGDLVLEGALPTFFPLAGVVETGGDLELQRVADIDVAALVQSRKVRAPAKAAVAAGTRWVDSARRAGASTAAIALGEIREQMAEALATGLPSVTLRSSEAMVARLRELGMAKQADLLGALAQRPDPSEKLDDFVKLHQVLGIALARLAGATHVDRTALVPVPTYESVFIRRSEHPLAPGEVVTALGAGRINRYEAAAHYARHYEALGPDALAAEIYPTWADGSASPYIARAFARHPEIALATARRVLDDAAGGARLPNERLRDPSHARVAKLTAVRVLEALGTLEARNVLLGAIKRMDAGLTAHARRALRGGVPDAEAKEAEELVTHVLDASRKEDRIRALRRLGDLGAVEAVPVMRASFAGDISSEVRMAAAYALAMVMDVDSVDAFVRLLRARDSDPDAKIGAYALGRLGDVRGIEELMRAFADGWQPGILADSMQLLGLAALEPLVGFIEEHPEVVERRAALRVLAGFPQDAILDLLISRLDPGAPSAELCARATLYLQMTREHDDTVALLARHILAARPGLGDKTSTTEERALARKCTKHAS